MQIEIYATDLPGHGWDGHSDVHVGLQYGRDVIGLHAANAEDAHWSTVCTTSRDRTGRVDVLGPAIHGRPSDRFLYLSWGHVDDAGTFTMFRRLKLMLNAIDPSVLEAAATVDRALVAHLSLTGEDGSPRCGSVRPPQISWSLAK